MSLSTGIATSSWPALGTIVHLRTTHEQAQASGRRLVTQALRAVEKSVDLEHRGDVRRVLRSGGRPVRVGALTADLLRAAEEAAERSDGLCDPTVGRLTLAATARAATTGTPLVPVCGGGTAAPTARAVTGWHLVRLEATGRPGWGGVVSAPAGTALDLRATASAFLAQACAAFVARQVGCGVLLDIGGDVAAFGPAPAGGWRVEVGATAAGRDVVRLRPGQVVATSGGRGVVDPRTGLPAPRVWARVSVLGHHLVVAKGLAVAAHVLGTDAVTWLQARGVTARLEHVDGTVVHLPAGRGTTAGQDAAAGVSSTREVPAAGSAVPSPSRPRAARIGRTPSPNQ